MEEPRWEDTHRALIARVGGALGIAFVVITLLPGNLGGPLFDTVSTAQILDWVKHNGAGITLDGFVGGLTSSLAAVFILIVVAVVRGRGLLASVVVASAAAFIAINWVHAGVEFALADAGQRLDADAGIVSLFSLDKAMTFADGFAFGISVVAVSVLAMRSGAVPALLVWLGLLVGGYHLVALPIQLAINGSASGVTGPVSVVTSLLWILATSAILLIKPIWGEQRRSPVPAPAV